MRKTIALLAALLTTAGLGLAVTTATPAAAASYSHSQLVKHANTLEFDDSLATFVKIRKAAKHGINTKFNWASNGCNDTPRGWADFFKASCQRHDFGYRNYGHGLNLGYSEAEKLKIDKRLLTGMQGQCYAKDNSSSCYLAADAIYDAIRSASGISYTAFYARTCPSGHFCLFDDHGYGDRRKALTVSHKYLSDLDFNDKTSSVKNYTSVSWIIYDDHYSDRRFCIKPGTKVSDLGASAYKFNDKASSAKRLASAACPKGTPTIG